MAARAPKSEELPALERYRAKRDFTRSPEPKAGTKRKRSRKTAGLAFVVHKHAARRLHYDLRLELDGVLKSWAVPQGPSLDPAERRLAVHAEDHPLDYGGFEGVIPKGEYGGGTVMLWDRGSWEPLGDPAADHAAGKLKFRLQGERLRGGWMLVRMRGKAQEKQDLWLLIKEQDEAAADGSEPGDSTAGDSKAGDSTAERSVLSGRTMDEIAAGPGRVWRSDRGDGATPSGHRKTSRKQPLAFVPPQLATLVEDAPTGQEWLHEIKYDGYRVQLQLRDRRATLLTRNGHDWTHRFRDLPQPDPRLVRG